MKRSTEAITPENPEGQLANDLENIAIDVRSTSGSISMAQQRRQVGKCGRSGGGEIGRVVRSAKVLCTK